MPRISWKKPGYYEKLGEVSLEDWLRANHLGRAPSELVAEISTIVGHQAPLSSVQHACQRLKLYVSRASRTRVYSAASRVRARDPVPEPDPDVIWEATKKMAKALEYKVSKQTNITVDFSSETRPVGIVYLCDLHIGGVGVDYDAIERDSKLIAETDGLFCNFGGDQVDNFLGAWALSAMAEQVITASPQWRLLEKHLAMLQDKVLYARVGNHDAWTAKMAQIDKFGELMCKYQVLNVKHIGVVTFKVGTQIYISEESHRFWGRSRLNPLHATQRLLDYGPACDPDILLVEHEHVPAAGRMWRRGKDRFLIRPGTYKTKDSWAQEKHFYGSSVAPAVLILSPKKHQVHLSFSVPDAAEYLTYLRSK